jgi:hypothetical protein
VVEVEIRNFQSIEKVSLKIDGFTVVVGRSNIGKSAIVRAVKAALTGAPVSSFVRHATSCLRKTKSAKTCKCFSSVHLKGDGMDLLWEKGDSINRYTYNGQVYDKAERGTPDFLQPAFSPVKVGDRHDLIQVADQFFPIFLLDQTGGTIADTLSDVAKLDRINVAMRLAEKDRKEALSTRKVRERDVVDLRNKLQVYEGLDDALEDAQRVVERQTAVERQERRLEEVERFLEQVAALAVIIRELEKVRLIVVPDIQPVLQVQERHNVLVRFTDYTEEREASVRALTGVDALEVPDLVGLLAQRDMFAQFDLWYGHVVQLRDWILPWKTVEEKPVPVIEPLLDACKRLQAVEGWVARQESLQEQITVLEYALAEIEKETVAIQEEIDALGVCPTCFRTLNECNGVC